MASVLVELGALHLTRPGLYASDAEVAAWYERKAAMLRHAAGQLDADRAAEWAGQAAAHAAALTAGLAAQGMGAAIAPRLVKVLGPDRIDQPMAA